MFVFDREQLDFIAQKIIGAGLRHGIKIVLAESCTGGEIAAAITRKEGASQFFCGSFVTYRPDSKIKWLGIYQEIIDKWTAESQYTANSMALNALGKTPEADLSLAVVGHLDNMNQRPFVVVAIACRNEEINVVLEAQQSLVADDRTQRQYEACIIALRYLITTLDDPTFIGNINNKPLSAS